MKSILIVDDEIDLTATFAMLFQLHGFEAYTAANGKEALAIVMNRRPDIVLSDLMMPVMDGVDLSRTLRNTPATAGIPIVLMSAAPEQHQLSQAVYDLFILKPARFKDMLAKISLLLQSGEDREAP